ncbi:Uma2 family endonuclease [Planktothricoides raciborskii]|uniref:Uma2 family endonuclease n=2 Tax=Planktothricoides raciborskii TaxID=132608 RepID=A0AAU8JK34_9CYAN|nr:Uma2 family endonuclease [Planktothricoides raciborskii]MBD2542582.1 Uma2 family endonuclease [Planktothricoides raciborskii FACHB-1370]MBD2581040.1 Uma2 family endonuclease [Planktothricoides raciborskii FACHB-1261]
MNLTLNLPQTWKMSQEQFAELAQINQDVRLELTAKGELIIMPPTGGETGNRNFDLTGQIWLWNRQKPLGKAFDSSTGFVLPNGANRSPDASWIRMERWEALTPEQRKKLLPLCPDFAVELVSESDRLSKTQEKMQEYLENGLRLGWLIEPKNKIVEIYRPNQAVEVLEFPLTLSGEDVLPNFTLSLAEIWD